MAGCAQKSETVQSKEFSVSQEELEEAPDEMLSSFTVSGYTKGGKKEWDLEGKSADISTEEIKLIDVNCKVYGKEMNMTILADAGSLNRVDNNVHLEKNVQATTDDGATMNTDSLDWDAQNEKLSNDVPTWVKRGTMEAYGIGIIAQPTLNLVQLKRDVIVKISPAEADPVRSRQGGTKEAAKEVSPSTVITCSGPLEVEYENNLAIFQDNVKVKDKRGEIFADRMDVYFSTQAEEGKQMEGMEGVGIEKVVATGNTEIHHGNNITYSQKAVYDTETGKLTLTGEPKLVIYSTESFSQLMGTE